jgi:hypothetical protein
MFGELYLEGVYDNAERGPMAIICGRGVDGNVADVYGETREDASIHALYIIHSVNDRLEREARARMARDDDYEEEDDLPEEGDRCQCPYCYCLNVTEYGICSECSSGAHQG